VPELSFQVERSEPVLHAAEPQIVFHLRINCSPETQPIHVVALRCQIRIDPLKRQYRPGEEEKLRDLFGEPSRWGQTLRAMLWTHVSVMVPGFVGSTTVPLPVPCSFDFNLATTKYFAGLNEGEVPLLFLFSGTIFHESEDGSLQVAPIPWEKETRFRLPIKDWREMMDHYYPDSAWLCLRRDVFDQLHQRKIARGILTWEQTIEQLLTLARRHDP
jgi:hypothetical protein